MNNDRLLAYLGIARRAGYLAAGTFSVKQALSRNRAALVLVASDISKKTEKELRFSAGGGADVIRITRSAAEVSNATGTRAGVFAITDNGLAEAIRKAGKLHDEI